MGKRSGSAKQVRVAEGIYRRGLGYAVAVYDPVTKKKRWHGPQCGAGCRHDRIADLGSARKAKRQLEEAKRVRAGRVDETVAGWAGRWLDLFPRRSPSTMRHNEERVRSFVREFGDRPLRGLREDEVWAWAKTAPSCVKEVRAMLNDAIKLRLLDENPLAHFSTPERRGRRDIQILSLDELDVLLECARVSWPGFADELAAMIEAAAWTGLRPGELFMCATSACEAWPRVNVVNFAAGRIDMDWQYNAKAGEVTRPKWDSMRRVVLLPRARAAFESVATGEPGPMFRTQRGKPYTGRTHHYYWDPIRRLFATKLPGSHWLNVRTREQGAKGSLDFYELRHFFGTALAQPPAGIRPASPYEIAQQMGHKDGGALAMRVYIHADADRVVADLGEAWAAQQPQKRRAG